jgi:hypothetical protein
MKTGTIFMRNGTNSLPTESEAQAAVVAVGRDRLEVALTDGRTVGAPLVWYPRLQQGTPKERKNYRLIGGGTGIHWPDLDEDISIEALLAGRRSFENPRSLAEWRRKRSK